MKRNYLNLIKCQKYEQIGYLSRRYLSEKVNDLEVKREVIILKRKEEILFNIIDSF